MNFSIIIPTFRNKPYLALCVNSIEKNSTYKHEIIVHLNGDDIESEEFIKNKNIIHTKSERNIGLCSGVNIASKKATKDHVLYAHDDMYFLPKWDYYSIKRQNSSSTHV